MPSALYLRIRYFSRTFTLVLLHLLQNKDYFKNIMIVIIVIMIIITLDIHVLLIIMRCRIRCTSNLGKLAQFLGILVNFQ